MEYQAEPDCVAAEQAWKISKLEHPSWCCAGANRGYRSMRRKLGVIAGLLRMQSRLRCSFCGKDADQVGRLVAGPSVYICDECIKTCVAVVEQHGGFPPARAAEQDRSTHA
jgi:hypothetical protein